ncbi:MAG: SDR family NAD(P)-dependent oxidoreductase [Candidatus Kariarchaeaceae archaeon]
MPPSINFETPNPNIEWNNSPFIVNTQAIDWKVVKNQVRRAGVSSFGFGGTNFHVIMEEYDQSRNYPDPEIIEFPSVSEIQKPDQSEKYLSWNEYSARNKDLEKESILLSARSLKELLEKLENLPDKIPSETISVNPNSEPLITAMQSLNFNHNHDFRLGIALPQLSDLNKYIKLTNGALQDKGRQGVARARGIFTSEGIPQGKVAFVFPGQGSQYADMLYDLSLKYRIVEETIEEADEILKDYLDEQLSSYLFTLGRDSKQINSLLRQTQFTQPAMLTVDIALYRLLKKYGIKPDMVAGHSLGEYAALVAAEVLTFKDALIAVAIRGKAMSEVDVEDKGTMASISGTIEEVESILKKIDGYVVAANKNSVSQTVISGSTEGIQNAVKEFESRGMSAIQLSVSAAFHTKIVEPAAEPLSKYLESIKFNKPKIPITSNVTGDFFPKNPEKIRNLLKQQVGSPVEWTQQVTKMNEKGATIFFEVGPKRALSSFVSDIVGERHVLTITCNHPKKGGIQTFNEVLAAAGAVGLPLKSFGSNSNIYVPEFRWPQNGKLVQTSAQVTVSKDPIFSPQEYASKSEPTPPTRSEEDSNVIKEFLDQTAQYLKSDTTKLYNYNLNLDDIVITGIGVGLPGMYKEIFDENNFERILNGENFIDQVPKEKLDAQLDRKIVRLIKKDGAEPVLHSPNSYEEVINLAGQSGKFNLVEEFQIGEELSETYDTSTELAIAAGLLALRDAGIPLVRSYKKTTTGSYLPGPWTLPEQLQDDTGVIFASAFPGIDKLTKEIQDFNDQRFVDNSKRLLSNLYSEISRKVGTDSEKNYLLNKIEIELSEIEKADHDYHFNRKLLLNVLSMGHSQFAQLIRARGPNTQVNAACASTTQAVGLANDWLRSGRCKRVIVISADNISNENMFPWLGTGFLASGAATTKTDVKEAALPFDRRREGMIIGMGAAALVIETESEAQRRGVTPLAELMGTFYANSSFHGTRLDLNHVSESVQQFMAQIEKAHGLSPDDLSKSMLFMSHETYTPRRGGSAGAEIQALRDTFGSQVSNIIVANTKGFTGHAMGAGIEDVVAIKAMEAGRIPPIANFKEGDEELGPLRLSKGENVSVDYALRLAAGFGSQVALALYKKRGSGNRFGMLYDSWLETIGGKRSELIKIGKSLRLKDNGVKGGRVSSVPSKKTQGKAKVKSKPVTVPLKSQLKTDPKTVSVSSTKSSQVSSPLSLDTTEVVKEITDLLAEKTGYPKDMLEPDLYFEEDLGIDSIKSAELFGEVREKFGITRRDDINLADLDTINKIAKFITENAQEGGSEQIDIPVEEPKIKEKSVDKVVITEKLSPIPIVDTSTQTLIIGYISEISGYPESLLDEFVNLRNDLGFDDNQIKQVLVKLSEITGKSPRSDVQNISTLEDLLGKQSTVEAPQMAVSDVNISPSTPVAEVKQEFQIGEGAKFEAVKDRVIDLLVVKTGYPKDMLEPDLEFEADLGIDSIKAAELFGEVREEYGIERREDINLADLDTINKIASYISSQDVSATIESESTKSEEETTETTLDTSSYRYAIRYNEKKVGKAKEKLKGVLISRKSKAIEGLATKLGLDVIPNLKTTTLLEPNSSLLLVNPSKSSIGSIFKLFSFIKSNIGNLNGLFIAVKSKNTEISPIHQQSPLQGAIGGLFKSISMEFPHIKAKIVVYEKADQLHKEMLNNGIEVVYNKNKRLVVALQSDNLPESSWKLSKFDILLASGGAQGITYEIIKNIITKGTTVILLGRTEIRSDASVIAMLSETELQERKDLLKEELKGSGKKVTPVILEKEWSLLYKSAQVWKHIKELEGLGATVCYESVDIANSKSVAKTMKKVSDEFNLNEITHFIHGAGLEISRPTTSKTQKEFELVYSVKVNGFENIYKFLTPTNLKRVLAFTSVAGRFGNATQADYSSANEYLAKRCRELVDSGIQATAIDWSAWAEVGMATRGSTMTVLSALGLTAIPMNDGIERAIQEIEHGQDIEVVISGELGALAEKATWFKGKSHPTVMIDNLEKSKLKAFRTISLEKDLYLDDHRISGKAVLPGVMGLETVAEMSRAIEGEHVFHLHDVKFSSSVKLPHDKELDLIITKDKNSEKYYVKSKFIGPDGKQLGDLREHFEMKSINSLRSPGFPVTDLSQLVKVANQTILKQEQIYGTLFHGPSYQVIRKLNEVTDLTAISTFNRPKKTMFNDEHELEIDPLAIEAGFQTAGLHLLITQKQMGLPSGIKQLTIFNQNNDPSYVKVQYLRSTDTYSYYDVDIVDKEGNVLIKLEEYETIHTGSMEIPGVQL